MYKLKDETAKNPKEVVWAFNTRDLMRASTCDHCIKLAIANPIEMGNTHEKAVETVANIAGYEMQFRVIFGDEGVTIDNIGRAMRGEPLRHAIDRSAGY